MRIADGRCASRRLPGPKRKYWIASGGGDAASLPPSVGGNDGRVHVGTHRDFNRCGENWDGRTRGVRFRERTYAPLSQGRAVDTAAWGGARRDPGVSANRGAAPRDPRTGAGPHGVRGAGSGAGRNACPGASGSTYPGANPAARAASQTNAAPAAACRCAAGTGATSAGRKTSAAGSATPAARGRAIPDGCRAAPAGTAAASATASAPACCCRCAFPC